MTKGELEEVYRRLCLTIRRKTDVHAEIGRELEQLHREADELERQIASYDDEQGEGRE